jgi:hypothetical protein
VLRHRLSYVLVITIVLALPGEFLSHEAGANFAREMGGAVLSLVASVSLVLVLISDLGARPLERDSTIQRIASATIRTIGAYLIMITPFFFAFATAAAVAVAVAPHSSWIALLSVLSVLVSVWLAPLSLVVPVCLNEDGGSMWALGRAWAMSRPSRAQMRILLGGLTVLENALTWLVRATGSGTALMAAVIALSTVGAVLSAGLLAVFYHRAVAGETPLTSSALYKPIASATSRQARSSTPSSRRR